MNRYYYSDGSVLDYRNYGKKLHRVGSPAVEYYSTKEWWVNGQFHRVDGPAREREDGHKEWFVNGKLHRTDGPAVEYVGGDKEWWVRGELHRTDGPAVEYEEEKIWFINGKHFTKEEFEKTILIMQLSGLLDD